MTLLIHIATLLLNIATSSPYVEKFAVWSRFYGRNHDPKKMIEDYDLMKRKLLKEIGRHHCLYKGSVGKMVFYLNVLSQGRLFNHYCSQIFSFLQHNTFYILMF